MSKKILKFNRLFLSFKFSTFRKLTKNFQFQLFQNTDQNKVLNSNKTFRKKLLGLRLQESIMQHDVK